MNALKNNQENEIKKEKIENLDKILTDNQKKIGMDVLKNNKEKETNKDDSDEEITIARRQTLTNLIIKKQTLQHAFDDNDDYDYEKEFLEMENKVKERKEKSFLI